MQEFMRANKKMAFGRLALGLVAGLVVFSPLAGRAGAEGPSAGQNPYPYGSSTYWAWQNRPDLPAKLGEAKDWQHNAASLGWPTGRYPRKGDVAVFAPGAFGAADAGRVAVVEQVLNDGSYIASQMDEADCASQPALCGHVNRQTYPSGSGAGFIHYIKDTRTTWGFAGGASGWTPGDMGEGNMEAPGWHYTLSEKHPYLVSPDLDIPLDGYNVVEIDMIAGAGVSNPAMQFYFATAEQPLFSSARSGTMSVKADGQLHTYRASFRPGSAWKGQLVRLRLDLPRGAASAVVRIDRVRLVHTDQPDSELTALVETHSPHPGGSRSLLLR